MRKKIVNRTYEHLQRAKRGDRVNALRLTDPTPAGPRFVPAVGDAWPGLPGLYSFDWPTTVGLHGEASLELAREAVKRGGFELVELEVPEIEAVAKRLAASEPDDAAIAEEVANHRWPGSAERTLLRLRREAEKYEYVHLGRSAGSKRPLPPTRG